MGEILWAIFINPFFLALLTTASCISVFLWLDSKGLI